MLFIVELGGTQILGTVHYFIKLIGFDYLIFGIKASFQSNVFK